MAPFALAVMAIFVGTAGAATPAEVLARVEQTRDLRALRLVEDPPPIPMEQYAEVARGEVVTGVMVVEGHAAKKAYGAKLVDLPIQEVWAAVNDELHHPEYTQVSYSELISGRPCESPRAVLQVLPLPLLATRWWITQFRANQVLAERSAGTMRELSWTSSIDASRVTSPEGRAQIAEAIPLVFTKGGWLLLGIDAHTTVLEYTIWTDPGGRVPTSLANSFGRAAIPDTLEAIERFARERVPACPQE